MGGVGSEEGGAEGRVGWGVAEGGGCRVGAAVAQVQVQVGQPWLACESEVYPVQFFMQCLLVRIRFLGSEFLLDCVARAF